MAELFEDSNSPSVVAGQIVEVAVHANLWGRFDYRFPEALGQPVVGQRVRVPFGRGNRKTLAFVTATGRPRPDFALKAIAEVIDVESPFDEVTWELGQWISHYYLTPLGMVLAAMVPSSVGRHSPRRQTVAFLDSTPDDWPGNLGARQRKILDELFEARRQGVEPVALESLHAHSGAGRDTVRRLLSRRLIRTETREITLADECRGEPQDAPFELNAEQASAAQAVGETLGKGFSAILLHGVTGSGKTEVYIRAIRDVVAAGKQAILLTPEIALATQTFQRLLCRLPRLSVLHSGLTDVQRAHQWRQIRQGHAAVVVGPRSAVFAPAGNLGLIIVDEEHEGSYKQDTAPRYHGRDVAIKRAQLADVPVLLGSATPSLESLHNARQGRYRLLRLPHRVRDLAMPALQVVHLRREIQSHRVELIGQTLTTLMAAALDRSEQVILLMNRRGYASYVFCPKGGCDWFLRCDQCDQPMVFHQAIALCSCHHCQRTMTLPEACPACGGKLLLFGYGIQRVEDELERKFPLARVARMDSDTMTSPEQFRKVLAAFADGEVDVLLGTQMVAKGLDFPKVSMVGVASADTALAVPDFRASERTFQLIVQVAGRAGRGQTPGRVVVQTLHAEEPAVQFALNHDFDGFSAQELQDRQAAELPPFSRMVRLIFRHEQGDTASEAAHEIAGLLRGMLPPEVRFIGPQPAVIRRLRNQFRFDLQLFSVRPGVIQRYLFSRMGDITSSVKADVQIDVDPVNLL